MDRVSDSPLDSEKMHQPETVVRGMLQKMEVRINNRESEKRTRIFLS